MSIVASTNVYGSIAAEVAGDHADVTSIIESPEQDPHSFEASARVQLELSRADVVVDNGGGYDDFMGRLLTGTGNDGAVVISAVDVSGLAPDQVAANEHVWYDLDVVRRVASSLADALERLDPPHASDYRSNLERFDASITRLQGEVSTIADDHAGESVMVTEPVPLYLLESAGFVNATPDELSTAVENGNGVPPAVLERALALLEDHSVSLFVYNEQTAGPETTQLRAAAKLAGVPTVGVTETITDGQGYVEWMGSVIRAIGQALS
ncbi:ABC transporter substrate-binding protein [Terrimesophilobacter mesophilus]|uniref:ABC transporter substrate-binding protein n=1 Tax=Terrimesophilobacter mesophilus TaxID=433647 RepID=A0A4R8VF25_9MICO|nr:zinc ABC transporter substrate-binding protein [Terrimesophilobacter mesophilus]TFB80812.1 ABC transporter substrate-binding protein [Terrimesophilobacter mesophilus]